MDQFDRVGPEQIPKTQQESKGTQASGKRGVQESQTRKGVCFADRPRRKSPSHDASPQLDPANQKSIIDIQNEAALEQERNALNADGNRKGKRKAPSPSGDDDSDDDVMDVGGLKASEDDGDQNSAALVTSDEMVPMPQVQSIAVLKEKLHARMEALRRPGAHNDEPGDRDELLEERRKQRAAVREKRRKETRERKKAEAESKKDKGKTKEKEKDSKSKIKVCLFPPSKMYLTSFLESITRDRPAGDVFFRSLWSS